MEGIDWSAYKCGLLIWHSQLGQSDLIRVRFTYCHGKVTAHKKKKKSESGRCSNTLLKGTPVSVTYMHDKILRLQKEKNMNFFHECYPIYCMDGKYIYISKKCNNIYHSWELQLQFFPQSGLSFKISSLKSSRLEKSL